MQDDNERQFVAFVALVEAKLLLEYREVMATYAKPEDLAMLLCALATEFD